MQDNTTLFYRKVIVPAMKKTQQKGSKGDDKSGMKWAYVGIALLVAVAMVGSYFAPMFNRGQTAQVGDTALIGYTIRDEDGRPIVTTDQKLLEREYNKGNYGLLLSDGLEVAVGSQVSGENITVIPILYPRISEFSGFSLLGFEMNAISEALVGMRAGEMKTVRFSYGANKLEKSLSEEDAEGLGLDITEWNVGDLVPLGLTLTPEIPVGNETAVTPALRLGKVTAKTPDSMVITYRYGSAEVTLYGITG